MYRKSNKSKRVSGGCRNNNSCSCCRSDRLHASTRRKYTANEQLKDDEQLKEARGEVRGDKIGS
jgi:hypothetical protein